MRSLTASLSLSLSSNNDGRLFSLLHHLILVIILSYEIRVAGSFLKESVKVFTPKSPHSTDNASLDLAAVYVMAHCSHAQTEYFRRFSERQ